MNYKDDYGDEAPYYEALNKINFFYNSNYIRIMDTDSIQLDGCFKAVELRAIADVLDLMEKDGPKS